MKESPRVRGIPVFDLRDHAYLAVSAADLTKSTAIP